MNYIAPEVTDITTLPWMGKAVCGAMCQTQPELWRLWQPGEDVDNDAYEVNRAREICYTCPVMMDCLEYALDTRQPSGIWGGLTYNQRRAELKRRAAWATRSTLDKDHIRMLTIPPPLRLKPTGSRAKIKYTHEDGELLSAKQIHLIEQVALGKSNAQIAQDMFLVPNTVKKYIREAAALLGYAGSRSGLVGAAFMAGVLKPPADDSLESVVAELGMHSVWLPLMRRDHGTLLQELADGGDDGQIQVHLGVDHDELTEHLDRLFIDLGATNRANAVYLAYRKGVLVIQEDDLNTEIK